MEANALGERYKVEERIAVGGMGAVYRATDTRLGRTVAIKVLKDGLAQDPRFVERFRREARSAAGLTHPNIAGVFDYGEEDGHYFIVMELADGIDLSRILLDEGPLPVDRALKISVATAEALGHAHRMGVVHRDVKPANIMVDAHDRVKVTDFGIARAAGDSTLTQTGTILGTTFYLSPEQASGDNLGPYSDVYSLGVVLYEMLTGAVPFTGDSPVSVAMKHLNEDVPAPSALKPELPTAMDDLVASATAKDPTARPADGTEFAALLRRALEPPVEPEPDAATVPIVAPAAAAPTMEIGSPSFEGPIDGERAWVLPGPPLPWGRIAWMTLGALAGLVVVLLGFRAIAGHDDGRTGGAGVPAGSDQNVLQDVPDTPTEETEAVDQPAGVTIPSDIAGQDAHEWEMDLKELGLQVVKVKEPSDEFEKHLVITTDPPPGSVVEPGGTVTLYESDGPPKEEKDKD